MANFLAAVPFERIGAEAREIRFTRVLLIVIAGFFYAVGWILGKTLGVLWLGLCWSGVAVKAGWKESRAKRPPPGEGG